MRGQAGAGLLSIEVASIHAVFFVPENVNSSQNLAALDRGVHHKIYIHQY